LSQPRALSCVASENYALLAGDKCTIAGASHLEKTFSGCESRRENEWRDLRAHSLIGPKTAPASFSHVVRNGAAGSHVVRAALPTTVSSNTRRTRERQF